MRKTKLICQRSRLLNGPSKPFDILMQGAIVSQSWCLTTYPLQ